MRSDLIFCKSRPICIGIFSCSWTQISIQEGYIGDAENWEYANRFIQPVRETARSISHGPSFHDYPIYHSAMLQPGRKPPLKRCVYVDVFKPCWDLFCDHAYVKLQVVWLINLLIDRVLSVIFVYFEFVKTYCTNLLRIANVISEIVPGPHFSKGDWLLWASPDSLAPCAVQLDPCHANCENRLVLGRVPRRGPKGNRG